MIDKYANECDAMLGYIKYAIIHSHGGPYCDEAYKKECIDFLEDLVDSMFP